ncbi:hypothetical protein AB0M46_12095 [Dactylosporangium sp. NPDC051485]|uniref:hypothetical protein n=1 Tax=Dactylosporangium sp. NPDC051485 TaxID=3154846 RepID=UPI0034123C14
MVDFATRSGSWPGEEEDLENAFNQLDHRCLQAQGIDDPASPPVRIPAPEDEAAAVGLPARRSAGYGLADPAPPQPEPSFTGSGEKLRAAQFGPGSPHLPVVIEGNATVDTPSRGCIAEAHERLAGDVATWTRLYYLPQRFDERMLAAMTHDARYSAALAAWSTCMRSRGYSYNSPDDAESALRSQYQKLGVTTALKRQEVRAAVDDGDCQLAEHLPTRLLQIRRSLVASLSRSDLETLAAMSRLRRDAVARARSVLATAAPSKRP